MLKYILIPSRGVTLLANILGAVVRIGSAQITVETLLLVGFGLFMGIAFVLKGGRNAKSTTHKEEGHLFKVLGWLIIILVLVAFGYKIIQGL